MHISRENFKTSCVAVGSMVAFWIRASKFFPVCAKPSSKDIIYMQSHFLQNGPIINSIEISRKIQETTTEILKIKKVFYL